MKLVTLASGRTAHPGVIVDGAVPLVLDLARAAARYPAVRGAVPRAAFRSILNLLAADAPALAAVPRLAAAFAADGAAPAGLAVPLARARLLAPVLYPGKLFALAGNYQAHIEEHGKPIAPQDRETPRIFLKPATNTIVGPGAPIRIPPVGHAIDWEGELAVVIGRSAKAVPAERALDYVAGYTILNDVSERKFKLRERSAPRDWDKFFDWLNGKWFDTFAPCGPYLATRDEVPDPQRLTISTYVNGERRQHCSTAQMIFGVAELVAFLSQFVTLAPGDIITTGTTAGVGAATNTYLHPGDRVKVAISGLGELENPVTAAPD